MKQDGSREWITVLAGIVADGRALSPAIIVQGETGHLREQWLADYLPGKSIRALFGTTQSGWISSDLALDWLKEVIDLETAQSGGAYRLLLLDGHSSHLTWQFLDFCDRSRIIIGLLPPHSTHLLQPLDVGLFGPLARFYSQQLEQKLSQLPLAGSINKSDFWLLFSAAWAQAATQSNVTSAFAKAGLFPFKPRAVLSQLPEMEEIQALEGDCLFQKLRTLRQRFRKRKILSLADVQELMTFFEQISIDYEVIQHKNDQLELSLARLSKKTLPKRQLLVPGMPDMGKGCFLSPSKIQRAREHQQSEEERLKLEAANKAEALVQKQLAADAKRQEAALRKEQRAQEAQIRQIRKEEEAKAIAERKLLRQETKELRQAGLVAKRQARIQKRQEAPPAKRRKLATSTFQERLIELEQPAPSPSKISKKGRIVRLPARFN
ncbi:MAG TPA: hypothetical protein VHV10_18250 [Ktedonobacteraceae bacterium]|nr:hypothetical protein [Ktedonobacteraceae bacterium]